MVLGLLAGTVLSPWPLAVLALAAAIVLGRRLRAARRLPILALLLVLGWVRMWMVMAPAVPDPASAVAVVSGRVQSVTERPWGAALQLPSAAIASDGAGVPARTGVIVHVRDPGDVVAGQLVQVRGQLGLPATATNPGGFDYRRYLRLRGISYLLSAPALTAGPEPGPGLIPAVHAARRRLERALDELYPPRQARLLRGLLLGEREALDPELARDFSAAGIGHLLAVSGLHIGVLVGCVAAAGRWLGLGGRWFVAAAGTMLLAYGTLLAWPPSVLRAAVMAAVALGRRRLPGLDALALATMVCLLVRPGDLTSPGLQLSVAAVAGIMAAAPRRRPAPGAGGWIGAAIAVSAAAQAAVLPILAYHFGTVSLVAVAGSVLSLPLVTVILPLAMLSVLLDLVPPALLLARLAAMVAGLATQLLAGVAGLVAALPLTTVTLPPPPLLPLALYLGGLGLGYQRRHRRRGAALVLLALGLYWFAYQVPPGRLDLIALDVGQGDATLLHWRGGAVLVDGGDTGRGRYDVLPLLRHRGIRRLDLVVATHAHADHVAGLLEVLEGIPVGELWHPGLETDAPHQRALLELAAALDIPTLTPRAGQRRQLPGRVTIQVLGPPLPLLRGTSCDVNNSSLVLRVSLGRVALLLTGDIHSEAEAAILAGGAPLRSALLRVAHHGSHSSSTEAFLEAVRPLHSIISVGPNRHGHPHDEVLERLAVWAQHNWRTDRGGAVSVATDGRELRVYNHAAGRPWWRALLGPLWPPDRLGATAARATAGVPQQQ